MRISHLGSRRLLRVGASGVGALTAGLGVGQSSDAAVVYTPVDADIPATPNDFHVDLNADGTTEFDLQQFFTITKVWDFAPGVGVVTDPADGRTANLAAGTLIGPASTFSDGIPEIPGGLAEDQLNGQVEEPPESGTFVPTGHFQVSNGPGFIGVQFPIGGNTHFGWVGYEGTGAENDATGHVFGLAFEDTPNTPLEAGAGIPAGVLGDYNNNGTVDASDYVLWRDGGPLQNEGDNPGTVDQADYDFWKAHFGEMLGGGSGFGAASAVPEPTSLWLLAAGATGVSLNRRRRSKCV